MTIGGPVDPEIEPRYVRRPPLGAAVLVVASGGALGPGPDALLARLFLVTGVLGGFTTFSALTVETVDLMRLDRA